MDKFAEKYQILHGKHAILFPEKAKKAWKKYLSLRVQYNLKTKIFYFVLKFAVRVIQHKIDMLLYNPNVYMHLKNKAVVTLT